MAIVHLYGAFDDIRKKFVDLGFTFEDLNDSFFGNIENILPAQTLNNLANNLEDVFKTSGTEGVKEIGNQLKGIFESMGDPKKFAEFVDALDDIDWNDASALEDLKGYLNEIGIYVPDEQIEKLSADLIALGNATKTVSLEKLTEQLEKIGNLTYQIKSGEKGYTGYTQEDVDEAVKAGIERSDFWYDYNSKSYTYNGDLNKLIEALNKTIEDYDTSFLEKDISNAKLFQEMGGEGIEKATLPEIRDFNK